MQIFRKIITISSGHLLKIVLSLFGYYGEFVSFLIFENINENMMHNFGFY